MTDPVSDTSLHILVNGEPRTAPSTSTVGALLRQLGIPPDRVAVEINLQIVDRHAFETRALEEGDRVEVISFIGGGSGGTGVNEMASGARRTRTIGMCSFDARHRGHFHRPLN